MIGIVNFNPFPLIGEIEGVNNRTYLKNIRAMIFMQDGRLILGELNVIKRPDISNCGYIAVDDNEPIAELYKQSLLKISLPNKN
jgi:hypothetical protein